VSRQIPRLSLQPLADDGGTPLAIFGPGRREAAFCHGILSNWYARTRYIEHGGDRAHCRLHRYRPFDRVHAFGSGESSSDPPFSAASIMSCGRHYQCK
jgi:hypothetical protein